MSSPYAPARIIPVDVAAGPGPLAVGALHDYLSASQRLSMLASDEELVAKARPLIAKVLAPAAATLGLCTEGGDYAFPLGDLAAGVPAVLAATVYEALRSQAFSLPGGAFWLPGEHDALGAPEIRAWLASLGVARPGDERAAFPGRDDEEPFLGGGLVWAAMTWSHGAASGLVGRLGGSEPPSPSEVLLVASVAHVTSLVLELRRLRRADGTAAPGTTAAKGLAATEGPAGDASSYYGASVDPLTGLATRAAFVERAAAVVMTGLRGGAACSAVCLDVDHFTDINDSFGHTVGDEVIAAVGRTIANRLRRGDLVGRYGGAHFVALLPGTPLDEAVALADDIRRLVATAHLVAVNPPLELHVSAGAAALKPGEGAEALLAAAAVALQQAKRSGRDRVQVAK
ncbi:MAG TPA: GGDEF domain-containing protein [Acidimicrobiales bacterium]|nr:GGDEF domain-containing protein [Acidimicrobiales bacterium]